MEINFVEEVAPLTEEQWARIIRYYRMKSGEQMAQGIIAAKQFCDGMNAIQSMAGQTQEHIGEVQAQLKALADSE